VGPPPRRRNAPIDQRFAAVARSITSQLLATRAATTIHARVLDACDGHVTEESILRVGPDTLRDAGLNRTKAEAMVALASMSLAGHINFDRHGRMSNDDITREITAVRGIGPWTAHMYLMFTLARPDIWPSGDYGVRYGWSIVHDEDDIISERALNDVGASLVGVQSATAWYCWQALHVFRGEQ
jgi:DNA-3-methyladenine glycosylase II